MLDLTDYTLLQDHSIAWSVYIGAAVVILLAYTQLTHRWWFWLRWLLFAWMAVFLLVPAPVPGRNVLAPAMIMVALSPFTGTPELIATVIVRLLLGATAALVLIIILGVIRHWLQRRNKST